MSIALRCGKDKCRKMYMAGDDEQQLEIDFYEMKITFICPNCKGENIINMKDWQKQQKLSPLPRTKIM